MIFEREGDILYGGDDDVIDIADKA